MIKGNLACFRVQKLLNERCRAGDTKLGWCQLMSMSDRQY